MNFHFNIWLSEKINSLRETYGNFDYEVMNEQDFIKETQYENDKIYIVTKALTPNMLYNDQIIQPYQILIMSEENSMELAQAIFTTIATNYNYSTFLDNEGTFIKFELTKPVVMSNFSEVKSGYRSILYMTSSLFIMENIADIENLSIDGESINVLSFNVSYTMSPDTQQMNNEDNQNFIAKSVKGTSGFAVSLSIPIKKDSELVTKVTKIMAEKTDTVVEDGQEESIPYDGNNTFALSFSLVNIEITKNVKLTAVTIMTAPDQLPSLQLGFIK